MVSTAADRRPGTDRAPATGTLVACPSCGGEHLLPAGVRRERRVCERCGSCWEPGPPPAEVDTLGCPGCPQRTVCESRPTWLAASLSSVHQLGDGTNVLVRPLLYSDRAELASRYDVLSPETKRLRFFGAPSHLSPEVLEYLTNIDYHDHYALGAFLPDEPGRPGVGVARFIRLDDDPRLAEAAVTVADEMQGRGIGTLLTICLAEAARERDIETFVSYVLWENATIIDALQALGARVAPGEPGVARLEMDLPSPEADADATPVHLVLRTVAAQRAPADRAVATASPGTDPSMFP